MLDVCKYIAIGHNNVLPKGKATFFEDGILDELVQQTNEALPNVFFEPAVYHKLHFDAYDEEIVNYYQKPLTLSAPTLRTKIVTKIMEDARQPVDHSTHLANDKSIDEE